MNMRKRTWMYAVLITAMMIVPTIPALSGEPRAAPVNIVRHIGTFGDGSMEATLKFTKAGKQIGPNLNIPNGASILSASMNITSEPLTPGGTDLPENVTVDLGDDGSPEWAFNGKGYGRMGEQYLLSNASATQNFMKVSLKKNTADKSTVIRLPARAQVSSATLNISAGQRIGTPGKILVLYGEYSYYAQDVTNILSSFPDFTTVDSYDANRNTPTWDDIKDYSAIITWTSPWNGYPYQNGANLGNLLANYVDAGGSLVVCSWAFWNSANWFLGGRFNTENYYVMQPSNSWSQWHQYSIGTVNDPTHPVMANVSYLGCYNGYFYSCNVNSVAAGATKIATYPDGVIFAAAGLVKGVARVDLNFWPVSQNYDYWYGWYGDGDDLMKNALLYGGAQPINVSLDVSDNGVAEFQDSSFMGNASIPDFSAELNDYLVNASPTFTDAYGNDFVDIPISLLSSGGGLVNVTGLDVRYTYTTGITDNPGSGNLAAAIEGLTSRSTDGQSTSITLAVYSIRPGKMKLWNISIDYKPPNHSAIITSWTPEDFIVEMNENETMDFNISAIDLYDYPMNVTWYVSNQVYLKNWSNMTWFADFDANGTYNVTVKVNNLATDTLRSWKLIVKNVNRNPVIDDFNPEKTYEMDENSTTVFDVVASDPDGDQLSYAWFADGKKVGTNDVSYEYRTNYFSAGKHEIRVTVTDPEGLSTVMTWAVTVKEVNAEPMIIDSTPGGTEVFMNENEVKKFSVADLSVDGDRLTELWSTDGTSTGATGKSFNFTTDYNSAGHHLVEVRVTDGKLSVSRSWDVTVADVNRPPVAVIFSPEVGTEFLTWDDIVLDGTPSSDPDGDVLNLTWSEGKKVLGSGATLTVHLARGKHLITLAADDGKKNGVGTAQIDITVRYIEFDGVVTAAVDKLVAGNKVTVSARLTNRGDGAIDEIPVLFRVDGKEVYSQLLQTIEPDTEYSVVFQWKAVSGDHKLEIVALNQSFIKTISIAKKPAAAVDNSAQTQLLGMAALVVIVALAAGAAVVIQRRRWAAAPPVEQRVAQMPETYAPMPSAAAPAAPAASEEAMAAEAIKSTEKILLEAEKVGLDTTRARQTFKIAQNFHQMGKYSKVVQYCKTAESYIE